MRKSHIYCLAVCTSVVCSVMPTQAAPLLGVAVSTLYDVSTQTGAATNPRGTGLPLAGIALSGEGLLYGLTTSEFLYTIDPASGDSSFIGPVPLPFGEGDIDFDPTTGTLYGVGFGSSLVIINPSDGDPTVVGNMAGVQDASAMAFDSNGTLFVIDTAQDELLRVNKSNGSILETLPLNVALGGTAGMGFDPDTGTLYVADGNPGSTNLLYTLETTNGVLTPVGTTISGGLTGLEFVPEPNTLLLITFGGFLLGKRRRS